MDVGDWQIRCSLGVAPLLLGRLDLSCEGGHEVVEQQVLAGHLHSQQPIQKSPAQQCPSACTWNLSVARWPAPGKTYLMAG